jgi:phenylalanyl-tRNA synthetase beta chain
MKISLKWLSDYVDVAEFFAKPQDLASLLTGAGLEVEGIEDLASRYRHVVVGHILEKGQHPSADRLSLCQVATGEGVVQQIVCGAQNHKAGDNVVVALPGAILPGDFVIKPSSIRGAESLGMLCSEKELGLKADSEGILILPEDAPVGTAFAAYMGLDDVVLELKVTPNRSDCLSHFGLAREVACLLGREARLPSEAIFGGARAGDAGSGPVGTGNAIADDAGERAESRIRLDVREPEMCPRYGGRFISGVRVGPSPAWLRKRLEAAGVNSINNVVDATNFVMLELGQPLHAFDAREIRGGTVVVERATAGERFITLDGTELALHGEELTIRDSERALVLAGVIGGKNSGVSDSTSEIFLECAYFSPAAIRRASRRHGIETDSSYRFARGVNPDAVPLALDRAAQLIAQVAGGSILAGALDFYPNPVPRRRIEIRLSDLSSRLGYEVEPTGFEDWMKRLGCDIQRSSRAGAEPAWTVEPPAFRWDLALDVDLVEEHARLNGYDKIPESAPPLASWPTEHDPSFALEARARRSLVAEGYAQAINYAFLSADFQTKIIGDVERWEGAGLPTASAPVPLLNPLNEELGAMRAALAPGLLKNVAHNSRFGNSWGRLFEIGFAHSRAKDEGYRQEARVGLALWGAAAGAPVDALWSGGEGAKAPPPVIELKGAIERWLRRMQISGVSWLVPEEGRRLPAFLHPGQCAIALVEGKPVGFIGGLHPALQDELKIREPAAMAELSLEKLFTGQPRGLSAKSISKFPAVERDVAFVMPKTLAAGAIQAEIVRVGGELLRETRAFDAYEGEPLGESERSVAFRLVFQDLGATLEDAQVNELRDRIVDACRQKFSVSLR